MSAGVAAGFPHPTDLHLVDQVHVDPESGEPLADGAGCIAAIGPGILIREDQIEALVCFGRSTRQRKRLMAEPQRAKRDSRRDGFSKRGGYPATKPISGMKPPTTKPGPGAKPSKTGRSRSQ